MTLLIASSALLVIGFWLFFGRVEINIRQLGANAQLREDLGILANEQFLYYDDSARYVTSLEALGVEARNESTLTLLTATDSGWTARAETGWNWNAGTLIEGVDCVAAGGQVAELPLTRLKGRSPRPGRIEGDVVCDLDGLGVTRYSYYRWRFGR